MPILRLFRYQNFQWKEGEGQKIWLEGLQKSCCKTISNFLFQNFESKLVRGRSLMDSNIFNPKLTWLLSFASKLLYTSLHLEISNPIQSTHSLRCDICLRRRYLFLYLPPPSDIQSLPKCPRGLSRDVDIVAGNQRL